MTGNSPPEPEQTRGAEECISLLLRESENKFFKAFQAVPDLFTISTLGDGRYIEINEAFERTLGYSRAEVIGHTTRELDIWEDPNERDRVVKMLREQRKVRDFEFRLRSKAGTVIDGLLSAELIEMKGEECLVAITKDITERKQAEEEREKLLVQLDAVLNSINEGVVIADLAGNILTMNASALSFHEYQSVEQVRRQLHQLTDTFELIDLAGRVVPLTDWPLSRALRGDRFTDVELRVKRRDKGTARIGCYSGTLVQTRSGEVILAVVTVRDITERKRAEAEIERLASFPLMNPNPVLELNVDGELTFSNPAAKAIIENARVNNGSNPLLPPDFPTILQDLRDKKSGQYIRDIEINGAFFEELIYITPQFQSVRIYTMDITERRRGEEEIERLNADLAARANELEAFNYTVAHDLRKPLTVISGYCEVVKELCGERLDEQCTRYLQEAYDGAWRMNQLIDALLNFSRMAQVEPRCETVDLTALAQEVALELRAAEPGRRVTLRIAEGMKALGDATLLRVVLNNLLGNAWKYTSIREMGRIECGVTSEEGRAVWFVRDNGPGFAAEDAQRLFTPFLRLPGAEKCRGFGIGLATVERIIRRHGGVVWAAGEAGKGATFYFTLGEGQG